MKFEILKADDIKVEIIKNQTYINILNRISISVSEDAYLMDIEPKYLVKEWITNLKSILLINEGRETLETKVGEKIVVRQAFTATGEVAAVYIKDKKVFTFYAKGENNQSVFDKAVEFAKIVNLYVDEGLSAMIIDSTSEYSEYYITIKNKKILYINPEAEFLGVDKEELVVKYQDLLYGALL